MRRHVPDARPVVHVERRSLGDKAANLGLLANRDVLGRKAQRYSQSQIAGYDITPQGFAIPLSFYNDFLAFPENAAVKAKVAVLIAAERGGKLSPNQRKTLSTELQQLFYAAKVPPAQLAAIQTQVERLKGMVHDLEKLKLRSSANAEDPGLRRRGPAKTASR